MPRMQGRSFAATLAALITLALPAAASAATFTVSTTGDAGAGSLRAAITSANSTSGRDSISFAIGLGGAQTITLASPLPDITEPVVIAGSTSGRGPRPADHDRRRDQRRDQGRGGRRHVRRDRHAAAAPAPHGLYQADLTVTGSYALIRDSVVDTSTGDGATFGAGGQGAVGGLADHGNRIAANGGAGVRVDNGAGAVIVSFNRIGLAASGLAASANAGGGVIVDAAGSQVTDNVISGNGVAGVRLADCASVFKRNIVGLGTDGATHVGNSGPGVEVRMAAGCQLGSAEADATDTISANTGPGVRIAGNNATVLGERIGTTSAGAPTAGNGAEGVLVNGVTGATVGTISFRNKIADNGGDGILLDGSATAAGGSLAGNDVSADGGDGVALMAPRTRRSTARRRPPTPGSGSTSATTASRATTPATRTRGRTGCRTSLCSRPCAGSSAGCASSGTSRSTARAGRTRSNCSATRPASQRQRRRARPLSGFTVVMPAGAPGTATFDVTVADDTAAGTQVAATARRQPHLRAVRLPRGDRSRRGRDDHADEQGGARGRKRRLHRAPRPATRVRPPTSTGRPTTAARRPRTTSAPAAASTSTRARPTRSSAPPP